MAHHKIFIRQIAAVLFAILLDIMNLYDNKKTFMRYYKLEK